MNGTPLLPGEKFGLLTVLFRTDEQSHGSYLYLCVCDCGGYKKTLPYRLRSEQTQSCGCLPKNRPGGTVNRTFAIPSGQRGQFPAEYRTWQRVKSRCLNPNVKQFHYYGGRGIRVCDRWLASFDAFLEDMGRRPSDAHSIERVDHDGDYCPENCVWLETRLQNRNKRNNRWVTYGTERLLLVEWAERIGVEFGLIRARLDSGWTPGQALNFEPPPEFMLRPHDGAVTTIEDREGRKIEEAAARLGMSKQAIYYRIERGWTVEDALSTPKGQRAASAPRIGRARKEAA